MIQRLCKFSTTFLVIVAVLNVFNPLRVDAKDDTGSSEPGIEISGTVTNFDQKTVELVMPDKKVQRFPRQWVSVQIKSGQTLTVHTTFSKYTKWQKEHSAR